MTHIDHASVADALAAATGRPHTAVHAPRAALPHFAALVETGEFDDSAFEELAACGRTVVAHRDFVGAALSFNAIAARLDRTPGVLLRLAQPDGGFGSRVHDTRFAVVDTAAGDRLAA